MKLVLPICKSDFALACAHAHWLASCRVNYPNTAVVCWDNSFNHPSISRYVLALRNLFQKVETFRYPAPPIIAWPQAPNWAWQHIALHMAKQNEPWLFFEADAVLLRTDALPVIEQEYTLRGNSWMGVVVPYMGHVNGIMVYPPDAAHRMPKSMEARELAWDYVSKDDINGDVHDCSDLFCHIWVIENDEAKPVGNGTPPRDFTVERARRWIKPRSVLAHRIKDSSLTRLLQSGEYRHA